MVDYNDSPIWNKAPNGDPNPQKRSMIPWCGSMVSDAFRDFTCDMMKAANIGIQPTWEDNGDGETNEATRADSGNAPEHLRPGSWFLQF